MCNEWAWSDANPNGDPKQVCYSEDFYNADDTPDDLCQSKFYENIASSYGSAVFIDECDYSHPSGGPARQSDYCDGSEPCSAPYTSGTETLGATLVDIDASTSQAVVTVGNLSDTVAVDGWIEVVESPFRVVQVSLQATEDVNLGGDTWEGAVLINTGPPRDGTINAGDFVIPLGGFKMDGAATKSGEHYAADVAPPGVATGTLSSSTFTMSYQFSGAIGAINLSVSGAVVSRPPVAAFSAGTPTGCSVTVDGTASIDPDGNSTIARWHWYTNGYPSGEGSTETVSLAPGTNIVELVVAYSTGLVSPVRAQTVVEASSCFP